MPGPDQHVGHLTAGRVKAESADWPDLAIGGVHVPAGALFYLTGRNDVDGLLLGDTGDVAAFHDWPARTDPAGRQQLDRDLVPGHELRQSLFRGLQVLEVRLGAAQLDLVRCRVDKIQWHKPGQPAPAFRLDHQMCDRASSGIENNGLYVAPVPIAADSLAAENNKC